MSLQNLFSRQLDQYANTDPEWVQYVHDHYTAIKARSGTVVFSMHDTSTMHYRLTDLLKTNNISSSITWIILLINQIGSENAFVDIEQLQIPDLTHLAQLRERFNTVQSLYRNARTKK